LLIEIIEINRKKFRPRKAPVFEAFSRNILAELFEAFLLAFLLEI
jgi:hypothetical protein